jgi:glycosyltransferase involved in cell wall biosynthesis
MFDGIDQPIIGFVGAIRDWLDYEVITELVAKKTNYEFVFVGSDSQLSVNISNIKSANNTTFTGPVDHKEIGKYINSFDIGLIPFKLNELTKYVDPIKKYEYMCFDVPILSSNLPDVRRHDSDAISIYDSPSDAIKRLDELVNGPRYKIPDRIVSNNTWETRGKTMFETISDTYE